jgi:predicted dienelactone hydrolase
MAVSCGSSAEYEPKRGPGPHAVGILDGEWTDADRDGREVPWRVYFPEHDDGPHPVVIWSHGGGGSREGSQFLGRHLASHGYAAFHIQHRGTDIEVIRNNPADLRQAVADPEAVFNRFMDVAFAVAQIDIMQENGPLEGCLDTASMGMSGHSLGCLATLIVAGQHLPDPFGQTLAVPRFKVAIAMSPAPPRPGYASPDAYNDMLVPIFHFTGTDDRSPMAGFPPEARLVPFKEIANVDQYLVVFKDGNHMTFTDRTEAFGQDLGYPSRDCHHELIKMAAVALWDAYLKGEDAARAWLEGGGFASELGAEGTFEFNPAE